MKQSHVLFNDARSYDVDHMVKGSLDNERGNPLLTLRGKQRLFLMHHPTCRIVPTAAVSIPDSNRYIQTVWDIQCHAIGEILY